jgi:hypothetical protein
MATNPDWSALRAKFTRDAEAFFAPPGKDVDRTRLHYALVDAAQVPEMRTAQFLASTIDHISLFSLTKEHGIAKYGPLLIPLPDGANSAAFKGVVRAMRHGWTVSWLSSNLSLEQLAAHLAGHLNGSLPDGSDVLVRFYDPRLLPHFLTHLDDTTRSALLEPIAEWGWWDRKLNFVSAEGGNQACSPAINQTDISLDTQEALAAAALDELIKSMVIDASDADEFAEWLPHALYAAVSVQLGKAREVGLSSISDLQLYVSLALRVHPDFFAMLPVFERARADLAAGETDLPALVLTVADDDWDRLGTAGAQALDGLRQQINNELYLTA